MKINYRQHHNRNRSAAKWLFGIIGIVLIAIALNTVPSLRNASRAGYAQLATAVDTLGIRNATQYITNSKSDLLHQRAELQTKLQKLELITLHNKTLTAENKRLKNLFYNTPINTTEHLARVVDYQDIPYGTLLVRLEGSGAVPRGSLAHFGELALGEVAESSNGVLLIKLFTASDAVYDVTVPITAKAGTSTQSTIPTLSTLGSFSGRSNGSGRVTLSSEYKVALGSSITLPMAGGKVLGTVQSIDAPSDAALQTLLIRTTVPLRDLRFITITPTL